MGAAAAANELTRETAAERNASGSPAREWLAAVGAIAVRLAVRARQRPPPAVPACAAPARPRLLIEPAPPRRGPSQEIATRRLYAQATARMTVLPARRLVELNAATASSSDATVPILVLMRPPRRRW